MSPKRSMRHASPNASATHPAPYNGRASRRTSRGWGPAVRVARKYNRSESRSGESSERPMTRLFGTDGIRGVANEEPLTPELAFRVGRQLVATLQFDHGADRVRLVIGRDTRRSGPLLEAALIAGGLSAGADCYSVGVLPTPGIAVLTRRLEAHGGIVLSASHNPFEDNGIKLFSSEGTKFPDAWEAEIEQRLEGPDRAPRARGAQIGALVSYNRAEAVYVDFLCGCFPLDLSRFTIALDCAHGATYRVAPRVFRRLGAKVITIGVRPDGTNINARCGALHPDNLQRKVRASGATIGFAFDGDGDRLISVDHTGEIRDGDYALAIAGRHLASRQRLKQNIVVTTVMANLFLDHAPAGDGILSALALLCVATETGEPLASLAACLRKFPQVLINVPVRSKPPIDSITGVGERMAAFEHEMNGRGRVLIRYSGTEALARVMIEGADGARIRAMADDLAGLIRVQIGAR